MKCFAKLYPSSTSGSWLGEFSKTKPEPTETPDSEIVEAFEMAEMFPKDILPRELFREWEGREMFPRELFLECPVLEREGLAEKDVVSMWGELTARVCVRVVACVIVVGGARVGVGLVRVCIWAAVCCICGAVVVVEG